MALPRSVPLPPSPLLRWTRGSLDSRREALIDLAVEELAKRARLLPQELVVARLIAHGKRGVEICSDLHIVRETYKTHSRRIYAKTGVDDAEHWRALVHSTVIRWLLASARPARAPLRRRNR